MLRIGVDIGGTFTDFAIWRTEADGYDRIESCKLPTSRPDFSQAVIDGISQIIERLGIAPDEQVLIAHGTTVSTNAVIERSEPPIALLTTAGFRDILSIARLRLDKPIDLFNRRPPPLVSRDWVFEVSERLRANGDVETPLDEASVVAAARKAVESGAAGIGLCFLHAYRNDAHERRALALIRQHFPDMPVVASHQVWPQQSEYERAVLTLLNVYVQRLMGSYIERIDRFLKERLVNARLFITKSNGGIMTSGEAQQLPVHTLLSGPAAGVTAAQTLAEYAGCDDVLTMDMGGTSTDLSLIQVGRSTVTAQATVGDFPLFLPVTAIEAMGAGAGSVVWMDGSVLKVGPRSAGSKPGPACYGLGGREPTLTDAYLLCGFLPDEGLLGGRLPLSRQLAEQAIGPLAQVAGTDSLAAAESCIAVATSSMQAKVLPFLARLGVGPSDLTLMIFGGAGGIHGPLLAEEVGIKRIIVPRLPSVFCAFGCLVADLVHDNVRSVTGLAMNAEEVHAAFDELAQDGRAWLESQALPGQVLEAASLYVAEMRYRAQSFTVSVDLSKEVAARADMAAIRQAFDAEHMRLFGHADVKSPVVINELRVRTIGRQAKPSARPSTAAGEAAGAVDPIRPIGKRDLRMRGEVLQGCPVYDRNALGAGWTGTGPAIIQQDLATILVPPNFTVAVGALGDLWLVKVQ